MKTNNFKGGIEPTKTAPKLGMDKTQMAKMLGRDCSEWHQRKPPHFETQLVPMWKKGLFWLGAMSLGR
jgi:hypothetical protein